MRRLLLLLILALLPIKGAWSQSFAPAEGVSSQTLTILCYNIRIGAGPEGPLESTQLVPNMEALAQYIVDSGADIAFLQEVDNGAKRTAEMDQPTFLAQHTGLHAQFAKAQDLQGGDYGVAVLSRWPVRDLKANLLFKPDYSQSNPEWPDWYSEQRVALSAIVETPGGPVRVINTHLGITEDQRAKQLEQIAAMIRDTDPALPLIFGGDLNAQPQERTLNPIRALLTDGWSAAAGTDPSAIFTFSAVKPERTIDYLFFSDHFHIKEITVPRVLLSDHLPVLARVEVARQQ